MAAAARCLGRVLIYHQRHSLSKLASQMSLYPCSVCVLVPNRHFAAAVKPAKKTKKGAKEKASDEKKDETEKIKSYPFMEGEPEDDVYLKRLYPRQIYEVEKAIHLLKKFQVLDFTNPKQGIYLDLTLDMALGKKNASEIKIAEENGAAFAGGTNLIQKILDDEIQPDFYVAVPEIMPELNPLKKKLKKRFPKFTRNSVGRDIPKMLELFKNGHEIKVDEERENFLETKIATLDMSSDQIAANLQAVINEVCRQRPLNLGPFVVRAFLRSSTSEGLLLKIEPLLPKEVETKESNT
ncbi:39S ribosomal protein L1, mitochondrial isoform X5 [Camelus ferus]|uniref:Large ribosomal subunit protein uL1m n=2 Tax=Camelus TaxID=9836 RepID=A0A8B8R7N8_CAMFR|nr:39S ribosomal protein L1, mitochondrial isoform X5 [Camelus dromedarius]XP_032313235.1 39S ribosomal protein L1, mitochondrial isoform X5 [Camelus ferus]XP_045362091.1 39S ribosomal protein L1, mitochondrial isoform X5 [Camelus bactrianus]